MAGRCLRGSPDAVSSAARELRRMLFHGPYWLLRSGVWRFKYHGKLHGAVRICILEQFGYPVVDFRIEEGSTEHLFIAQNDLAHFECVAYAATPETEIEFDRIEFVREG
jgi:hypothetical protein